MNLQEIKEHFSYCIDEGLTIGESEEKLLNELYAKVEQLEKRAIMVIRKAKYD